METNPDLYINREQSLLEFHDRVLSQALDKEVPLLERLRFLCISSTNLDEFFEVRVGGLKQRLETGIQLCGPDGLLPQENLNRIYQRAHKLVERQYHTLNNVLLPELANNGIRVLRRTDWSEAQHAWLQNYFEQEVLPLISPIGLDPAHPFPRILNKSLNFIVQLHGKDAFGRNSGLATVQCPRSLPEMIILPANLEGGGSHDFVFVSSIVHAFLDNIFYGMKVEDCYQFRVTRNSDLMLDEEDMKDLKRQIEGELITRQFGDEVRLEVAKNCPDNLVAFLLNECEMTNNDLYRVDGPVNLNRLMSIVEGVDQPSLTYTPYESRIPKVVKRQNDIFATIRKQDILLHHPFDSFKVVVDLIHQAATDPQVIAIKQTLYRTGPKSVIVDDLVTAAKNGKEVTVVIELRARFDEEANVELAAKLQEVGIHVVYGVVGYKTHSKMLMIVRRESDKLRHYVHLGTGNYHPKTSRIYTDYGLMTCDKAMGDDVYRIFLQLTSLGKVNKMERILQSPFTLHKSMLRMIDREISHAKQGKPARIIAKMNSLYEQQLTDKLYEASAAGVKIDLIVRGICQIRPNLVGVSENIRVISVVGRFLEHTRAFVFENDGAHEVYCSSADWMARNMFSRVETCFPVLNLKLKESIIDDLNRYLDDNCLAWELSYDGSYQRLTPNKDEPARNAQQYMMQKQIG